MRIWIVLRTIATVQFVVPILQELERRGARMVVSFTYDVEAESEGEAYDWFRRQVPSADVVPIDLTERTYLQSRLVRRLILPARELRSYAEQARYWPPVLRTRAVKMLPSPLQRGIFGLQRRGWRHVLENDLVRGLLALVERVYPPPLGLLRQLRRLAPDAVVVSPMIYPATREVDAVKAARALGIPTACLVLSWDNLSSKGTFAALPDEVFVWNDVQRREAAEFHRLPPDRVSAIGAPVFDYLFDESLAVSRESFLADVDLGACDRYVLYAVSSLIGLGGGGERAVVRELARALRARLGEEAPAILVRPHPKNREGWTQVDDPAIRVWERPSFAHSERARQGLYNSLLHADAVVGLNTSMFLEAAIVDRPCISIVFSEDRPERVITSFTHFRYLIDGGFLQLARDEHDAAAAIGRVLAGEDKLARARRAFVDSFIRPAGRNRPAAEVVAQRILALARERT